MLYVYCCLRRFARTKRPAMIAPLIPLSFFVGYQADLAWGNKMERIIGKDNHHRKWGGTLTFPLHAKFEISLMEESLT